MKKIYHSKWFPRIFYTKPDGGTNSGVKAFFLIEWKILFSIGNIAILTEKSKWKKSVRTQPLYD